MLCPSSSTLPSTRAPGTSSCIRLSVRRSVDFPQPEGPISAVTVLATNARFTPRTPVLAPYQAVRCSTARRGVMSTCASGLDCATLLACAGCAAAAGDRIEESRPASGMGSSGTCGDPREGPKYQHQHDQHERARPRLPVPFLLG